MAPPKDPSPVVTDARDPSLLTDLEIIALNEPGKGEALRRLLERANLTQRELASRLGYDPKSEAGRTSVSHWIAELRWPSPARVREILLALHIDRKILLDKFGIELGKDASPAHESRQLTVSLRNELAFELDDFERRDIIFTSTAEKVLMFQAVKAFEDTRAAQLFFDRYDKHMEEKQKRSKQNTRNVTPGQTQWMQGIYVVDPQETVEDWDPYSGAQSDVRPAMRMATDPSKPTPTGGS